MAGADDRGWRASGITVAVAAGKLN